MAWWRDARGFTLAQVLVACALVGFVLAAVGTVIERGLRQTYVDTHMSNAQQGTRVALELMTREIRETTAPLTAATTTSLTFTHPDAGVVTYTIDGTNTLTRNGVAIVGNLQNLAVNPPLPLFTYSDVNENALAAPVGDPTSVFRVTVTIQGGDDGLVPSGALAARTALTTSVRLRNL
jgi:Tfp pilus assembly protein PilW